MNIVRASTSLGTGARIDRLSRSASRRKKPSAATGIESLESRRLLTTIVVNSISDASPAGVITLRDAITMANSDTTSPNTITFDPTVFAAAQTIVLNGSQLEFSNTQQPATITGPAAGLTISAAGQSSIFQIDQGVTVGISGLTLTDGAGTGGGAGGAIDNAGGTLTLNDSTLTGNTDPIHGGAFYQNGDAATTMNDDTISSNTCSNADGGGIAIYGGMLTLTNSTVADNTSAQYGGGIFNEFIMTLINDTIANNVANGGNGGGIEESGGAAGATIEDCTISGNQLNAATVNGSPNGGGGVANQDAEGGEPCTIANTIIAGNTVSDGAVGADVDGPFTSAGNNLIGQTDFGSGFISSDLTGTAADPLSADLGSLADNGGPTLTMLPLAGSPAIDAGSNALIPSGITTDQRGVARIANGYVDIGAVEVQRPPTQVAFSQMPSPAAADAILSPAVTVYVENASGNLIVTDSSSVTLTIASGPAGAKLDGTTTVSAQNGVATFSNLSLSQAGAFTLTASDGTLLSATSISFNVTVPVPTQVGFASTPSSALARVTLSPAVTVDVENSTGNTIVTDNSDVTLAIAGGPAGATLGGTTTMAAQNGVATFTNLTLSEAGTYTLTASDGALTGATSGSISVTSPSPVVPVLGKVILPAALVAGAKLKARVPLVLTNDGSAFKGIDLTINIDADTGTTLSGNPVLVTTLTRKFSLKAEKRQAVNFNINKAVSSLLVGTYHLLAEVVYPSVGMSAVATTQTVQVATAFIKPVVSVGAVTPSSIALKKSGSVVVTVANNGNVPARGVNIMLSPASLSSTVFTPVAGVILESFHSGITIQPNKSRKFKLHFKVTSALPAGSHYPYVSVLLGGVSTAAGGTTPFTAA